MQKDELIKTLLDIDEEVFLLIGEQGPKPRVIIVGGAAFMLNDLTSRTVTHDIDVYEVDSLIRGVIAQYPNVNGAVSAYADQIPYNFEDRLVRLKIGARAIDWFSPSPEDLMVMKLYAYRPNDVQDLDGAASSGKIDWGLLDSLVYSEDEAKASAISQRRYREMADMYENFKERWGR